MKRRYNKGDLVYVENEMYIFIVDKMEIAFVDWYEFYDIRYPEKILCKDENYIEDLRYVNANVKRYFNGVEIAKTRTNNEP